ncbi:Hypothetical predicted protein [Cloeon dipterum]|uniref:Uncharacterized protein n=1 Tax=Cloeon dipterum TaxID=197152 RepID=A0A8S1E148_9INSE|nr:Hypothetical predicted protein [Cloeon dipterum]
MTPLHFALQKENFEVAEALLKSGADSKVKIEGNILLIFCICKKLRRSAEFVVEKFAEQIMEAGAEGQTALHVAARLADLEFFRFLIREAIAHAAHKASDIWCFTLTQTTLTLPLRNPGIKSWDEQISLLFRIFRKFSFLSPQCRVQDFEEENDFVIHERARNESFRRKNDNRPDAFDACSQGQ